MPKGLAETWQDAFVEVVRRSKRAGPLRDASLAGRLGDWTAALTGVAVETCETLGWQASARGHRLELLPEPRSEYLALDLVAFGEGEKRWRFPVAVMELENSLGDDRIAYSLWKVLCVRAELRVVFCYRRRPEQGSALIHHLQAEVVAALDVELRSRLEGRTLVVVGSRGEAETFPYGFFRWWRLERNTGTFHLLGGG